MENKDEILDRFISKSANKIIIGTSALEVGLDIPRIRFSVHLNKIKGLINLEQGIGRIGRDNKASVAYIIADPAKYSRPKFNFPNSAIANIEDFKKLDYNKLIEFIQAKKCSRIILESYFNNKTVECCVEPIVKCYLCQQHNLLLESSQKAEIQKNIIRENQFQELYSKLEIWNNLCLFCLIHQDYEVSIGHKLYSCTEYKNKNNYNSYLNMIKYSKNYIRKQRLFKEGSCCFQCYLSEKVCNNRNIKLINCEYENILLEISVLIWYLQRNQKIPIKLKCLNNADKHIWLDLPKYSQYISQHIVWNNSDNIKMLEIFLEIQIELLESILKSN